MLIFIVLICILIWYGVKRYKRSADTDGLLDQEEMPKSLKQEIREIVLKYKYVILIGSTIMVIGSIGWMYYMFYVPYIKHRQIRNKNEWQFGSEFVWLRHFEEINVHTEDVHQPEQSMSKGCGEFSKDNYLENMKMLKKYSKYPGSVDVFEKLTDKRSKTEKTMYYSKVSHPVVITEGTLENFDDVQRFVKHSESKFIERYSDYKVLIYDIGMTFQQKYVLLNCSQCEVIENFAGNLTSYSWIPVVIYTSLQRFKSVIWVNVSTVDMAELNDYFQNEGDFPGFQIHSEPHLNILPRRRRTLDFAYSNDKEQTKEQSLDMLLTVRECQKLKTLSNPSLIYSNNSPFTMQNIITPWTLCSVKGDCSLPELCERSAHADGITSCESDVFVLNFILYSLFGNTAHLFYATDNPAV